MKNISKFKLIKSLLSRKASAFPATIVARTKENSLRAKRDGVENPYWTAHKEGRLVKVSRVNGFLNWIYANSVNRQRDREGHTEEFTAEPRKWGERVKGTPFVRHTNKAGERKVYLELKVENSLDSWYELDGEKIDRNLIVPFLAPRKESARQETEKPIICRDYSLDNVVSINYGGESYALEG